MSYFTFTRDSDGSGFVLDTAFLGDYMQLNFQVNPAVVHFKVHNQPEQDVLWSNIRPDSQPGQQFDRTGGLGFIIKKTGIAGGQQYHLNNDGDYIKVIKFGIGGNVFEIKAQGVVHSNIGGIELVSDPSTPVALHV